MKLNNENLKLKRLELRLIGDSIDILYRPNHDYIKFVKNNQEGHQEIEKIINMPRNKFKEYLSELNGRHPLYEKNFTNLKNSSKEQWYQGAWKGQTENLLNKLKLKNPIEKPIFEKEFIEDNE